MPDHRSLLYRIALAALIGSSWNMDGANAADGTVLSYFSGCDYFIVETDQGFALLEWYGGPDLSVGDKIAGDLENLGFATLYNRNKDSEFRAWVEDFSLSKSAALEMYHDECD